MDNYIVHRMPIHGGHRRCPLLIMMLLILFAEQHAELILIELIVMLSLVALIRHIARRRWLKVDWRVCVRLARLADSMRGQM